MKNRPSLLFLAASLLFLPLSASISDTKTSSSTQQSILAPPIPPASPQSPSEPAPLHVPTPEEIQTPSYEGAFAKMLLTLVGLIALVFMTVWLLRKLTQGKIGAFGKKHINIVERRPLSPKSILYIVEVGGKQILVAESQLEIKTLATLDGLSEENS